MLETMDIDFENQPKVTTKEYTLREIFEAIKKNGLLHLRGEWYGTNDKGKVNGACVLGQAAFNLNVPANDNYSPEGNLESELNNFPLDQNSKWATYNGSRIYKVGDAIITWNDAYSFEKDGRVAQDSKGRSKYALRTYDQVVKMAHEILEPYFDKTVSLPYYEY